MFDKPKAGWCTINIEDFRGHASFIQPFVLNLLTALNEYFETGNARCVNFDEEGSDFTIIFTRYGGVTLQINRQYLVAHRLNMSALDFAKEVVKDFEENISDWEKYIHYDEDCYCYLDIKDNKNILKFHNELNKLKELIKKEEE